MNNINNKLLREKFHPGEHIKDIIEEMKITQEEFAIKSGISLKDLNELINGTAKMIDEYAIKLGAMFGMNPQGWINLQSSYDKYISQIA